MSNIEFPHYSHWTPEQNARLVKCNGKASMLVCFSDSIWVDKLIYKDRPENNRIIAASSELIHYSLNYSYPVFIKIDFSVLVHDYVLLISNHCKYSYFSFHTMEECLNHLKTLEDGGNYIEHIIVQLSQMDLFTYNKTDQNHVKHPAKYPVNK